MTLSSSRHLAFFYFKLSAILNTKKRRPEIKAEHYIKALDRMNIAIIFLDERPYKGEDPQIIFETLLNL